MEYRKDVLLIGIIGQIRAGKSTVAELILSHIDTNTYDEEIVPAELFEFSRPLRKILDTLYLPHEREYLQNLGNRLREDFGVHTISNAVAGEINQSKCKIAIVSGIRMRSDLILMDYFKNNILIYVTAPLEVRFARENEENKKNGRRLKTLEEFTLEAQNPTELEIEEISKKAMFKINNDQSVDSLENAVENILNTVL